MSLRSKVTNDVIEFKGSKNGLIIIVKQKSTLDEIKMSIIDKLESAIGFFNGAKISSIESEFLSDVDIIQIKDEIISKFDIEFIDEDIVKSNREQIRTKYVDNLRSGENVEHDGDVVIMADMKSGSKVTSKSNVVVMGNIESGAKVVAYGNIVVMGYIKGFIHAGANGNENSYVVASEFRPKNLQIAENFAEAPEEEILSNGKKILSEIAFISDKMMVVESNISKK